MVFLYFCSLFLFLCLFCKERTTDDDSVPCGVQCLESKRLRFHQTVLFCLVLPVFMWFLVCLCLFMCCVFWVWSWSKSNVLVRYCPILIYLFHILILQDSHCCLTAILTHLFLFIIWRPCDVILIFSMWILPSFYIFFLIWILQDHVTACLSVFHSFSLFCSLFLFLCLFCKERTTDDDSVPCGV